MQATSKGSDQYAQAGLRLCWSVAHTTLFEISRYGSNGTTGVVLNHMFMYSKTCVKCCHFQKDRKLVFKNNYRLMPVKNIAECSKGNILQYFRTSLSCHLSLRSLFCLFLSCHNTKATDKPEALKRDYIYNIDKLF